MDRYKEKIDIFLRKHAKYLLVSAFGIGLGCGLLFGLLIKGDSDCELAEDRAIAEADSPARSSGELQIEESSQSVSLGGAIEEGERDQDLGRVCVDVSGAVNSRGVYCLTGGSLVVDYLNQAGGVDRKKAAVEYVEQALNMASQINENTKVYIPYRTEVKCEALILSYGDKEADQTDIQNSISSYTDPTTIIKPIDNSSDGNIPSDKDCIDVNKASVEELDELNGVGESTATQIISARPFSSVEDLLNVSGIGEAKLSQFKDQLCEF